MKILVTGSAGHLGEGLMRHLDAIGMRPVGLEIKPSQFTSHVATHNRHKRDAFDDDNLKLNELLFRRAVPGGRNTAD